MSVAARALPPGALVRAAFPDGMPPDVAAQRERERHRQRSRRKRAARAAFFSLHVVRHMWGLKGERLRDLVDKQPLAEARPRTRHDCGAVPRPCPYVACRFNLYLDVTPTGGIKLNFPDLEPGDMPPTGSCALDVADRGEHTLEEVGELLNVTRERMRQLENEALVAIEGTVHLPVLRGFE